MREGKEFVKNVEVFLKFKKITATPMPLEEKQKPQI
jgi:hypothetical protein